jgi:hypothetical protein
MQAFAFSPGDSSTAPPERDLHAEDRWGRQSIFSRRTSTVQAARCGPLPHYF